MEKDLSVKGGGEEKKNLKNTIKRARRAGEAAWGRRRGDVRGRGEVSRRAARFAEAPSALSTMCKGCRESCGFPVCIQLK